jgi:hypothetical protein
MSLRAGLDDMEKIKLFPPPGFELRPFGCPARSQSLYRLRYPCSPYVCMYACMHVIIIIIMALQPFLGPFAAFSVS